MVAGIFLSMNKIIFKGNQLDISDHEFDKKKDKQIKSAEEMLNKIAHLVSKSNCDEGDILVVATVFLGRAIYGALPFLPFGGGPSEGPMVLLKNSDDILEAVFEQVKTQLEIFQKEESIH